MATEHDDLDREPDIRSLRDAAKQGKAALSENADLKRQLMFAKAGIDTDSKLGTLLFKTWESDDLDALKAEASELGIMSSTGSPRPSATAEDRTQGDFRSTLAAGTAPGANTADDSRDPIDEAYSQFYADRKKGVPAEDARLAAMDRVLVAAGRGDKRVIFDPNDWSARALVAGTGMRGLDG